MKALFTLFLTTSLSLGWSQVINLEGDWKFHIDDRSTWSSPTYDDSKWETIYAPSAWEDQGFNGYDGFAWYRKKFDGRKLTAGESYQLALGFIDDCDEVFLNGKLIGFSGSMPPHFKTAYNTERQYLLPANLINFTGENLIAIRVFDVVHGGGIIDGRVGVYKMQKDKRMLVDLQGIWDFAKSENGEAVIEEKKWSNIMVPGPWEQQGFYKYDGFGWYRKSFTLPAGIKVDDLILVLGKIDDFDKAYLNGQLIGTTNDRRPYGMSGSYEVLRAYDIPKEFIKSGPNILEIRVQDLGNTGGIYEGPVGIMTRGSYERYYQE